MRNNKCTISIVRTTVTMACIVNIICNYINSFLASMFKGAGAY